MTVKLLPHLNPSDLARFEAKVRLSDAGCHLWTASVNRSGYGHFKVQGKLYMAHRLAWVIGGHAEPGDLQVLHRCDTPPCVNPAHLFLGDNDENVADKMAKGRHPNTVKTECIHGHPFTDENTYITPRGARMCRACNRNAQASYAARKRDTPCHV